jgi:hypothetical protein
MFEVEHFHEERAFFDNLSTQIHSEINRYEIADLYKGLTISFGILVDENLLNRVITTQKELGINRRPYIRFAREFVQLLKKHVPSKYSIPEGDKGIMIQVDRLLYPCMSTLVENLIVHRAPANDSRKIDDIEQMRIITYSGYLINTSEAITSKLIGKMREKIDDKRQKHIDKWHSIDHSILVAHEFSRDYQYQVVPIDWPKYLSMSLKKINLLDFYDELWFVRPVKIGMSHDIVEEKAQFIAGKYLGVVK